MQPVLEYNLLIMGRSGSGKSATTKLLTCNPAIKVANSLREVTTEVQLYEGSAFEVGGEEVRFRVLDIPGLDKLNNRALIREKILERLEETGMVLHGIVCVSSLTERDTIDQAKLFAFLDQLPWSRDQKKGALIPIFTKYDNLVIDSPEEEVVSTKREFQQLFEGREWGQAWGKRIYWINHTKSLQFKIKSYEEVREKYQKQIERLITMLKRTRHPLTARAIRQMIEQEDRFVLGKLFKGLPEKVAWRRQARSHDVVLRVQVEPHTLEESVTAVSASSIGIFITRVCQKEVASSLALVLTGIPIAIALLKLASESFVLHQKKVGQRSSGQTIMRSYQHICGQINKEMEREWQQLNERLEFKVYGKYLCCSVSLNPAFKFFSLPDLQLTYDGRPFEKTLHEVSLQFALPLPPFQQETVWTPEIVVSYQVNKFSQEEVLTHIESLRKEFCSRI